MTKPLSKDWLEAVKGSGRPRNCDGCGQSIRPGERFHINGHSTDLVVECDSCHKQRFSWFYQPRPCGIIYYVLAAILWIAITIAGGWVLILLVR